MEAARPHEAARRLVGGEGVVVPAVPQCAAGIYEFLGHRIALGVRRVLAAEHHGRFVVGRRHHVPCRASAAQVIQRGEAAGHVIGLGVGRRARRGEPDPRGTHGERREERQRLELADGRGMLAVAGGEAVAQEEHVELPALGGGRDVLHQCEVGPAVHRGIGMPPAAYVMTRCLHEDAEAHLTANRTLLHVPSSFRLRVHAPMRAVSAYLPYKH